LGWPVAARCGERQVVTIAGEPGIGKMRLAMETAWRAHGAGAVILFGSCDADVGLPYRPFVEALQHYLNEVADEVLVEYLRGRRRDLVRLIPELTSRVPGLPKGPAADTETGHYLMFEAIAELLAAGSPISRPTSSRDRTRDRRPAGCLWSFTNGLAASMIRGITPLTAMGLLILSGGSMLLLTLTAAEFLEDGVILTTTVEWTAKLSTSAERLSSAMPLSGYQQTTARPIFFKTRQPFVAPPPAPPPPQPIVAPPPPPPAVVDPGPAVGGVMITSEVKKAYLFRKTDRTGAWVAEGEEIMGWQVQSIDDGGARLKKDGREIELPLYAQP
jgi:hypothetical protein